MMREKKRNKPFKNDPRRHFSHMLRLATVRLSDRRTFLQILFQLKVRIQTEVLIF